MNDLKELVLTPEEAFSEGWENRLQKKLHLAPEERFEIQKRSIDARKGIKVRVRGSIKSITDPVHQLEYIKPENQVEQADPVIIVGSGPAGLFAALKLIELGLKPIILERGGDVRARRRDLANINKKHIVNPESNYCFGEGGAGTYSDGKLYTRSKKRGDLQRILEILVAHGANPEILIDAHPHIGTNKLPKLIADMRQTILSRGGEVHFDTKVVDLKLKNGELTGVVLEDGSEVNGIGVILATGHSARDVFELLDRKKIEIESKPFAIGVRVEHPQQLIDRLQYKLKDRGKYLPAASYAVVDQVQQAGKKRGVFSFCMCPGGFIVPSATSKGEVVVNGMSPSRRDSKYANSGIVVTVDQSDFGDQSPLEGLRYQQKIEQKAGKASGHSQTAPAQRLTDFIHNRSSSSFPECSYQPGLIDHDIASLFPKLISDSLKQGFKSFGKKMRGYLTEEAVIVGVESRTSSPVKIPRDRETCEHIRIKRLFPCGEGAGYAGGIVSAAMDGERCATALAKLYSSIRKA
ncbi:MAG: FAD-dependent protein [Bacteroidota bacterium]